MTSPLTLAALHDLALQWCPPFARWDRIIAHPRAEWGSAHEIAHALLSLPHERTRRDYGLCSIGSCRCPGDRCDVVELAAMAISAKLHLAIGRRDLIDAELQATEDYDYLDTRWHRTRAARLLARRGLQRIPRTCAGLERLLRRRLGR